MAESQEGVALELLNLVLKNQDQSVKTTKDHILTTYAECLKAAKGNKKGIGDDLGAQPKVRVL